MRNIDYLICKYHNVTFLEPVIPLSVIVNQGSRRPKVRLTKNLVALGNGQVYDEKQDKQNSAQHRKQPPPHHNGERRTLHLTKIPNKEMVESLRMEMRVRRSYCIV